MWRQFGAKMLQMPSIQVKDVPDDVHQTMTRRAREKGMSLQEFLLQKLVDEARQPTVDEVLRDAGSRKGSSISIGAAVEAVRADRDAG